MEEKVKSLTNPSLEEAKKLGENAVEEEGMLVMLGECIVDYVGRTKTEGYIPKGDRLVFVKKDGTMHVQSTENKQPIRWQNSGASCELRIEDEELVVETRGYNKGTEDVVTVFFSNLYQITHFDAVDKEVSSSADSLQGTEKDVKKYIEKNPDIIEEGFRYIEEEKTTKEGPVDIFGKDSNNNPVIVEIKTRHAQKSHVRQLNSYMQNYKNVDPSVRGILVAPSIAETAKEKLDNENLEFVSVHPHESIEEIESNETTIDDF